MPRKSGSRGVTIPSPSVLRSVSELPEFSKLSVLSVLSDSSDSFELADSSELFVEISSESTPMIAWSVFLTAWSVMYISVSIYS